MRITINNKMNYYYSSVPIVVFMLLIILQLCSSSSLDAITQGRPLKDGDILISPGKTFALGFFSPAKNSTRRYVGMWYNTVPGQTVIWVANRDNAINDTSGVLAVGSAGGLTLSVANRSSPVWSANMSHVSSNKKENSFVAKLSDIGNFALFDDDGKSVAWQSFDHPTDTWVPFMMLGLNRKKGQNRFLTSWKSPDDPATGNCKLEIDTAGVPQMFLRRGRVPVWRVGPWTGLQWSGLPGMRRFIFNVTYVETPNEVSLTDTLLVTSILTRMVVEGSGKTYRTMWHRETGRWGEFWSSTKESCDSYSICGGNGFCDQTVEDVGGCVCMPGFKPRVPREWDLREGSGGCVRKRAFGCDGGDGGDGFAKLALAKLPDTSEAQVIASGLAPLMVEDCERECLKNCSCTAYSAVNESVGGASRCVMWYGNLVDTRVFSTGGLDLYVRVDSVTLGEYAKKTKRSGGSIMLKLAIGLSSGVVLFILFIVVWCAKKIKKVKYEKKRFYSVKANKTLAFSEDFADKKELGEGREKSELPFFTLNAIALATENFAPHNKLGEGGFGSVYKGTLSDSREIAVKRLSKYSGQGTEEFKNEVILIANLQHRNLVRILGCCVHGEEKMLIYEFLPNKSLDIFIFDDTRRRMLDWNKWFDIICGIARGLLYLHQDSRLRIIHRDLKASNVLLDGDMNPKIADFGLARRFGGDQSEGNTIRVVGTYGYMSPEYAMEGRFSTKSDVYSFGVLLLEIMTGKKNTSHFLENPDSNLVGYVWKFWKQGNALELVESSIDGLIDSEAMKCIHIGLLCVQEYANDRPSMSTVVFMLGNDTPMVAPKQPAFMSKRSSPAGHVWTADGDDSINDVTCTIVGPR